MIHPRCLHSFTTITAAVVMLAIPSLSLADTIVDTGPGRSGITGGLGIIPPGSGTQHSVAVEFSVAGPTTIDSIEAWGSTRDPDTIYRVTLTADDAVGLYPGEVPGTELFSATTAFSAIIYSNHWMGISSLNWTVGAGTYWAIFSVDVGYVTIAGTNSAGGPIAPLGNEALYIEEQPTGREWTPSDNLDMGVRIMGSPAVTVPDSGASGALLGGAFLLIAMLCRRVVR